MTEYTYNQFTDDVPALGKQCSSFAPDTIVAIARGGMTLAHALAMYLDLRDLQSIRCESYDDTIQRSTITIIGNCDLEHSHRILIVDDIVDSGKTLHALLDFLHEKHPKKRFKTASLFTKSTALVQPDFSLYEATDWIDFFWERDFLKPDSL